MAVSVRHLVGREDELAALLDLLDAPADSLAAAVVVGEAGIGKTTLWLAAAEAAEARGYLVLSCRPSEAEARFSFVGVADLIGAARRAGAVAERLTREGTSVHYVRTTFVPGDETCFHLFEAASEEAVGEACRRAGIGPARIVPAEE